MLNTAIVKVTNSGDKLSTLEAVDELCGTTEADPLRGGDVAHRHAVAEQQPSHDLHLMDRDGADFRKLALQAGGHRFKKATPQFGLGSFEPVQ